MPAVTVYYRRWCYIYSAAIPEKAPGHSLETEQITIGT